MAGIDGVFRSLDISGSALTAQRFNMEVISGNLAYSDIDSRNNWQPYQRREVTFETILGHSLGGSRSASAFGGVRAKIRVDSSPGDQVNAPDGYGEGDMGVKDGKIQKSNVDVSQEMVHLLEASRTYEANIAAVKAFREMVNRALSIGR